MLAMHSAVLSLAFDVRAVQTGRGIAPRRAFSAVASQMDIQPKNGGMAYTIDGDLYRTHEPVAISLGPHIDFLKPPLRVDCAPARRYHGRPAMSSSFPLDGMRLRFAGDSNVGMKRAHNEDSFYLPESERLAIVADGMGGHASGEVASRMAVDTIVGFFKATQDEQQLTWPFKMDHGHRYDVNRMVTAIKLANLKIHEQAQKDPRCHGMGTTVVSTLFLDDALIVGHVGDSRLYRRRDGVMKQLTEDHSLLNDYIKMKHLTPDEIAAFPHKNVIVRALGMKDTVQVDVHVDKPAPGRPLRHLLRRPVGHGQGRGDRRRSRPASDDLDAMLREADRDRQQERRPRQHHRRRRPHRDSPRRGSDRPTALIRRDDAVGVTTASRRCRSTTAPGQTTAARARAPAATRAPAPTTTSGPTVGARLDDRAGVDPAGGEHARARVDAAPRIDADERPGRSGSSDGSRSSARLPAR